MYCAYAFVLQIVTLALTGAATHKKEGGNNFFLVNYWQPTEVSDRPVSLYRRISDLIP